MVPFERADTIVGGAPNMWERKRGRRYEAF